MYRIIIKEVQTKLQNIRCTMEHCEGHHQVNKNDKKKLITGVHSQHLSYSLHSLGYERGSLEKNIQAMRKYVSGDANIELNKKKKISLMQNQDS